MRRRTLIVGLTVLAVLVASGGFVVGWQLLPSAADRPETVPSKRPSPSASQGKAQPWQDRPEVQLQYDIAADHESASGVEEVAFTPDRKVCDWLVFRAWPNKPELARHGGAMTVDEAEVAGAEVDPQVERRGAPAGAPGTLVKLPLESCVGAGDTVRARLEFTVEMAKGSGDRVGTHRGEMWFASAYPVLAWERGHGWMVDPAVDVFGEMDGSEEFRLDLEVVAPARDSVLGTGRSLGTADGPRPGTMRHRFAADSVRNVAVSAGGYAVTERVIDGVRTRVGVPAEGAESGGKAWLDAVEAAMGRLQDRFGRFPYRDLWVTVVPDDTTGIEFPGAIFYGDASPPEVSRSEVVGHELAHMWFYSLVGNNQGRDPWLDEAFATYAQALADGQQAAYLADAPMPDAAKNRVGEPMTYWADHPDDYGTGVYRQGATMLFEARQQVGKRKWDAAMRVYLTKHAHQLVRSDDFVAAVDHLPGAVRTLEKYGAVD
ncbi:MAG: hypothetical protein GEV07_27025 [Streptosporangiales bacterium]|nr:hypothetical protein [Streptosporangiales bacterium]